MVYRVKGIDLRVGRCILQGLKDWKDIHFGGLEINWYGYICRVIS